MRNIDNVWKSLGQEFGIASNYWASILYDLATRYREPHRAYHTLDHIEALVQTASMSPVPRMCKNYKAVLLALYFHDAVYDTQAHDNEEKSAELLESKILMEGENEEFVAECKRLVLMTKHNAIPTDIDAQIVVDIDLSILGAKPSVFDKYEVDIRLEYTWVPEEQFRTVRKSILEGFLNREHIYSLPYFQDFWEQQAQENLKKSIALLS